MMHLSQSGQNPKLNDTTAGQHCGAWRGVERAIGKWLLPQAAEAQRPGRPARVPPLLPVGDTVARTVTAEPPSVLTGFTEAATTAQEEQSARTTADKFLVEIHKKYAISVACFTFVLIGVAMALRFPRGGMGLVIGGGSAIFATFYVGLVGGEALADRGFISPVMGMWGPNLIFTAVGIIGLIRVNREFGSTRGGDLTELFDALTRPFRLRKRSG